MLLRYLYKLVLGAGYDLRLVLYLAVPHHELAACDDIFYAVAVRRVYEVGHEAARGQEERIFGIDN